MIKKTLLSALLGLFCIGSTYAGGILTNTNQSARFARLFALESMTNAADAAYYNPAGTIKLSEGFHFTFSNQSAFQERRITSTFPLVNNGQPKLYKGTASAPIIPSLQGVYRKGKWALSGNLAIVGGGGKATFNDGLPMFEVPISTLPAKLNATFADAASKLPPGMLPTDAGFHAEGYSLNQYMTGTNYIFGGQIGGAYEINKMFSVYGGFRLNIVHNKYEGHLKDLKLGITAQNLTALGIPNSNGELTNPSPIFHFAETLPAGILDEETKTLLALPAKAAADGAYLDSKQSGWGVAPIIGVNFSYAGLNIGAKYEFKTALEIENKTTKDDTGQFGNGVNTAHDVPALLAVGASYDIIDPLTVSIGYHHFFDKSAGMAENKQEYLTGGTNEYLFGAEWRIDKMFLISMGGQITRYGLADKFQSDLSFSVNSYSLGFGGAVNVSKNVQINVGYFYTDYSDYKLTEMVEIGTNQIPNQKTYTRKNKVFAAGVDFSF